MLFSRHGEFTSAPQQRPATRDFAAIVVTPEKGITFSECGPRPGQTEYSTKTSDGGAPNRQSHDLRSCDAARNVDGRISPKA